MLSDKTPEQLDKIVEALSGLGETEVDLDAFDYTQVKVKKSSFWVMQLSADGFVGPNNEYSHEFKEGYKPNFQLIICGHLVHIIALPTYSNGDARRR